MAVIVVFFIVREIYLRGEFVVVDELGMIWEQGSYRKCSNWLYKNKVYNGSFYKIRKISR